MRLRELLWLLPGVLRLLRRLAADGTLPRGVRVRLWLLLAYLALPIDLIADFIPVLGYADDAVVALVLRSVVRGGPGRPRCPGTGGPPRTAGTGCAASPGCLPEERHGPRLAGGRDGGRADEDAEDQGQTDGDLEDGSPKATADTKASSSS